MVPNGLQDDQIDKILASGDIVKVRTLFQGVILPQIIKNVNGQFTPRQLIKLDRKTESLPTEQKKLSSYRTRMGTILEYSVSTEMDKWLAANCKSCYHLCFVSYHDYPDFVLRDAKHQVLYRIEMKSVDLESDEHAARFDAATIHINPKKDLILFIAWEWRSSQSNGVDIEYPYIFSHVIVRALELAVERDARLKDLGGKIVGETVYVISTKTKKYIEDPGNYGKFHRIVTKERIESGSLTEDVIAFVKFLGGIDSRAPRQRMNRIKNPYADKLSKVAKFK